MAEMKAPFAKLNSGNFFTWKYKMELYLIKEKVWSVINTHKPTVPETGATDAQTKAASDWQERDDLARANIGLMVEDDQLPHIRGKLTAKDIWISLKDFYEKDTLGNKVMIMRRICNKKLSEGGDMRTHLAELSEVFQKLVDLGESTLTDSWRVAIVLSSLPECYNSLVTALEVKTEAELTFAYVQSKLIDEYTRRNESKQCESGDAAVLRTTENELTCFFCKKPGHFKKHCQEFKDYRSKNKGKSSGKGNGKRQSKGDEANTIQENGEQNGNSGDYLFMVSLSKSNKWIIDSGATSHISNNKQLFSTLDTEKCSSIDVANGNKESVKGKGTIKIAMVNDCGSVHSAAIQDVLYAPDIAGNMISVLKLCRRGYEVLFKGEQCTISKDKLTVAIADVEDNLYQLREQQRVYAVQNHEKCIHYWHKLFGHRDSEAIRKMAASNLIEGLKIVDCGINVQCETCMEAKSTRLPFPKHAESKSTKTLDLVHTDVCGPMRTISQSGKRYVLTFVDDFSRYTVVYLLSQKSEVEQKLKEYVEMVKNKFGRKPVIIRSNRGGEYTGKAVKKYLASQGISIQYTAPYTPEQNGVSERKNRTLIEMSRCLLTEAELPNTFWAEAVLTANYIQNRVLTRAKEATPYELWNGSKPGINHFQIFGSKCYVH